MDMRKWFADAIAADKKKAIPVLSFPAVQKMGITVKDLIDSSEYQAKAMEIVASEVPTGASVSFMDLSVEAEAFGADIVFSDTEVPTVVGQLLGEDDDASKLVVPKVGDGRTGLYLTAISNVAKTVTDRPIFAGIIGPYSLAGRLMDVSDIMIRCCEEPEVVEGILEKCTDFLIEYAKAYKEAGANGVVMAEPLAGVLSPSLNEEFSLPYCKRIIDAVQTDEFAVIYHNCGRGTVDMIDGIIANGAMGYHFGNAIEMADIMPHIPAGRIAMGNISPTGEIRDGDPESIHTAVKELLESCSKFPNFIISTGCDVPPLAPWVNIHAFFDAVDEYYGR